MASALIALGGNLGDPAASMKQALDWLGQHPRVQVEAISSLYSTAPVGTAAGGGFLNAAARLSTDLAPLELLNLLQEAEQLGGRVRTIHWGPRTLDLDLIGYDDLVLDHPRLQIPHPACWYRRFVLDPLAEIAPDWLHPVQQLTVAELVVRLQSRPLPIVLDLPEPLLEELISALLNEFPGQLRVNDLGTNPTLRLATMSLTGSRTIVVDPTATAAALVELVRAALDEPHRLP